MKRYIPEEIKYNSNFNDYIFSEYLHGNGDRPSVRNQCVFSSRVRLTVNLVSTEGQPLILDSSSSIVIGRLNEKWKVDAVVEATAHIFASEKVASLVFPSPLSLTLLARYIIDALTPCITRFRGINLISLHGNRILHARVCSKISMLTGKSGEIEKTGIKRLKEVELFRCKIKSVYMKCF